MADIEMNEAGPAQPRTRVALPELYDGKPAGCRNFQNKCQLYIRLHPDQFLDHEAKILWAGALLKGHAFDWFQPYLEDFLEHDDATDRDDATTEMFASYISFEEKLKQAFGDTEAERTAVRKIQQLKQTGTVNDYAQSFRGYAVQIEWDDDALKDTFRLGLKKEIKEKMIMEDIPDSLDDMIKLATKIDGRLTEWKIETHGMYPRQAYSPNTRRYRPNYRNRHDPMDLDAFQKQNDVKGPFKGKCFNCDKEGHRAADCKTPKRASQTRGGYRGKGRGSYQKSSGRTRTIAMFRHYHSEDESDDELTHDVYDPYGDLWDSEDNLDYKKEVVSEYRAEISRRDQLRMNLLDDPQEEGTANLIEEGTSPSEKNDSDESSQERETITQKQERMKQEQYQLNQSSQSHRNAVRARMAAREELFAKEYLKVMREVRRLYPNEPVHIKERLRCYDEQGQPGLCMDPLCETHQGLHQVLGRHHGGTATISDRYQLLTRAQQLMLCKEEGDITQGEHKLHHTLPYYQCSTKECLFHLKEKQEEMWNQEKQVLPHYGMPKDIQEQQSKDEQNTSHLVHLLRQATLKAEGAEPRGMLARHEV